MSADPGPGGPPTEVRPVPAVVVGGYPVDARGAMGVQVGEGGTQINYYYGERTWADGVVAPPLATVSGVIDSPYRGLSAFEERDAPFFFGREAAATQVLERMSQQLKETGLLVVSGVSGAGKSSLLRAGLLPRLRGAGLASAPGSASWPCLLFTPARAPLDELAVRVARLAGADAAAVRRGLGTDPAGFALTARQAAMAQPGGPVGDPGGPEPGQRRLLLMIDQFEQLFTQCPDEEQRQTFIAAVHAAATAGHGPNQEPATLVVLGVRADFEARCADYPQLADAVQDRYLVTAMTERQLRMAITEPAKKAGSGVDDDLADALLREVRSRDRAISGAGVLPLLSHALDQAWRNRAESILTLADYERTGGIEGALADSAQRTYDRLIPAQQAAAQQVFIRLTATSSDGADTADRAARAELTEGKSQAQARDVEAVLEAFAAERLLILAAGTVEISHEILLTSWPLLRDTWLAETSADRIVRTRLRGTAAEWARSSRDPTYLYSGSLLETATQTATRMAADPDRYPPLSRTEHDFLHASGRAAARRARQRRAVAAVLVMLLVASLAGAGIAITAANRANQAAKNALSGRLAAQSEALDITDPVSAARLATAAWRIAPTAVAHQSLLDALAQPERGVFSTDSRAVGVVAFSPRGTILATASVNGMARLWDVATHRQIGAPLPAGGGVGAVAFSPGGMILATAGATAGGPGMARLWSVATHRQIGAPMTADGATTGGISEVAFSPDGKLLATAGGDGMTRLWSVATHRQVGAPMPVSASGVNAMAFSPDGKFLATAGADGTAQLWSVATHRPAGPPIISGSAPDRIVYSVAFSPDGRTLATGSRDATARLWDIATRQQIGAPMTAGISANGGVFGVAFSPDGRTLATANSDGTARLWDLASHRQAGESLPSDSAVYGVAFSPDGKTLATASKDGTARLWDAGIYRQAGSAIAAGDRLTGGVREVAFSPHGGMLASAGDSALLWNAATHRQIGAPMAAHTDGVFGVAFSPDGKTLATASYDGTARLWDVATHRQIGSVISVAPSVIGGASSVDFSPDGTTLVTASGDGRVRFWDVATHRRIGTALRAAGVYMAVFSPDGKTLATTGFTARLWDVATHRQIGAPLAAGSRGVDWVAFSPDGTTLATASYDGAARLWDVATHRQIGLPMVANTIGVNSVAFSPDGTTLVTGSDVAARLWNVATQQQIGVPLGSGNSSLFQAAFSPDGRTIATVSADGNARIWNVAFSGNLLRTVCGLAGRSLTRQEWATDVQSQPFQQTCP